MHSLLTIWSDFYMKTRNCIVCGTEYEYCPKCKAHANLPAWKSIYHDDNCRNIMNIATDYMAGALTKSAAKSQLDECDLSNKKNFKASVLKAINDICAGKKSSKAEPKKVIEEPVEELEEVECNE